VRDPALESYLEAVERMLALRRGTPYALSPREFALARGWFEAGVALPAVELGIERAFEREPRLASLAYCQGFVEAEAARRAAPPTPAPPAELAAEDLAGRVAALARGLERQPGVAGFERPLRRLREIADLLSVAPRPNWSYLRGLLEEIEEQVSRAAIETLSAAQRAALSAEADAPARRSGRSETGDARRAQLARRARERLGLPGLPVV
jgi:hypothetical protein